MTLDLEQLCEHEAAYYAFSSALEVAECCWYLSCPDLPESRDVNRALRLRDDGRGPEAVAQHAALHFRVAGTRASIEIDAVSEAQGIGFAVRRLGITPVIQSRLLMRMTRSATASDSPESVQVVEIDRHADRSLLDKWVETNLHDIETYERAQMWRTLSFYA